MIAFTAPGPGMSATGAAADDRRAAEAFLRDAAAAVLRRVFHSLEQAGEQHDAVAPAQQLVYAATQAFQLRDYAQALEGAFQGYRMLAALHRSHPDLPDLLGETPLPAGALP